MKIDSLTAASIAFAGFALYYVFKPKTASAATTSSAASAADSIYGTSAAQRQAVGSALSQNTQYLFTTEWANLSSMGGGQGLHL